MSTFLPELPTTQRVPTYNLLRRLFRALSGVLNRLGPWNFSPTAAFALARRVNQYSEQTLSFQRARAAAINVGEVLMAFQPTGTGEVIDWRVGAADEQAFGGSLNTITCRIYRDGVQIGTNYNIGGAGANPAPETLNSAFDGTNRYHVELFSANPDPGLDVVPYWFVEVRLEQQLVASP